MLSKSFKATKCKTSLKLAMARIKLVKNRREVQLKQMKKELAQILEAGQEQTALIRVENVFKEEKTVAAYNFIEIYCELVVAHLPIIESQKNCPINLKEAITSVIYASQRSADIPELQDVCKQFVAKFGKEFVTSALELRSDCGVNHLVIEKLSAIPPNGETKIKILSMIAQEHNVKWDPSASKEQVLKPHEDLLNGPCNFMSASKFHMESPDVHFKPPNQKHETSAKSFTNDVLKSSPSSQSFYSSNTNSPTNSKHMASHPESRTSSIGERKAGMEEFGHSFSKDGNASLKRKNWNMKFRDATSAAQAAAECAEMASAAARAAAELSSHEYVASLSSPESHESSFHGPSNEETERSTNSKLTADHARRSGKIEGVSPRGSVRLKSKTHGRQSNEMEQRPGSGAAESRYDRYDSIRGSRMSMSSQSNVISTDEDTAVGNIQNLHRFSQVDAFVPSERIAKNRVSSQSDDLLPVRFDELEGLTSDSEEENCNFRGKTVSHSSSRKQNVSTRSPSLASSDAELHVLDNCWKRYGVGHAPDSKGSRRHVKSPGISNDLDMELSYSSMSKEVQDQHSSRISSAKEAETNNDAASLSPATPKRSEFSNYPSGGNNSTLNITGGLRNKFLDKSSPSQSNTGVPDSSDFGARSRLSQEQSYSPAVESVPKTLGPAVDSRRKVNSISFHPNILVEQPSETHPQIKVLACKERSNSTPNSDVENQSKTLHKTVVSDSSNSSKPLGASGISTSRGGSLEIPSHVHPKLPDYDTLAAQFKALKSNRRSL